MALESESSICRNNQGVHFDNRRILCMVNSFFVMSINSCCDCDVQMVHKEGFLDKFQLSEFKIRSVARHFSIVRQPNGNF